ncbi:hypothetical protein [Tissierella sp. Yu-01]|uniref:hypothetical protein n=1 Tax=Tissierella sp. Yu-01 TaxID=3035694 RepID=UPI00240D3319|nr:hypothetical protein [Tissierella sp. Yu-01]WFA08294.1 hypothetical protein P3962_11205 [Tissierella sp. Yu-01]
MDWSKAKSILIIALIVTNVLLGYFLYINESNKDSTLEDDFIQEVVRLLENKDIRLETEIPKTNPSLLKLSVEYEIVKPETLNKNFFGENGVIETKGEGLIEIRHENELISVINEKLIIYEAKNQDVKYDITSEEEAIDIATNFLKDRNISLSDMKLSFVRVANGVYNLEFTKFFDESYLEATFTNVQVNNTGVIKLERNWLNTRDFGDKSIELSTAPKSLLALISMGEVYGKTIKDISLCYYFDPEKHGYNDNPREVQQGSTNPAWRIQFTDGYKVFIDNY